MALPWLEMRYQDGIVFHPAAVARRMESEPTSGRPQAEGHQVPVTRSSCAARTVHEGRPSAVNLCVSVRGQPVDGGLEVVDFEGHVAQPQLVGHCAGDPGLWSGRTKLDRSSRVPPSGGRSMTISVRESGMPLAVSRNSPSKNVRPSICRPSLTKNAVAVSRSATVMPTCRSVVRVAWA
jgi:hypothetical protein